MIIRFVLAEAILPPLNVRSIAIGLGIINEAMDGIDVPSYDGMVDMLPAVSRRCRRFAQ
jgi:hypothetical protein